MVPRIEFFSSFVAVLYTTIVFLISYMKTLHTVRFFPKLLEVKPVTKSKIFAIVAAKLYTPVTLTAD